MGEFKLTLAQLASSLLGYGGIGVAIACFVPLILSNAARRKNGTGGGFLSLWLLADVLNIIGLFSLGSAPLTQLFLGFWYLIADIFLGIELCLWGHPGRVSPNPTPAATLIKRLDMEHKHQWIARFDRQFADWSLWDNAKLVMSCIFLGFSWWGLYVVNMLYLKQGDFEIEIPTDHSAKAIGFGITASVLFTLARLPEYVEGRQRHKKQKKPTLELSDGVFVFLIIENAFNLASILILSLDPSLDADSRATYLSGEVPWILGAVIPIGFDIFLVWNIYRWQQAWKRNPYADQSKKKRDYLVALETDIEHSKAELKYLEEQFAKEEVGIAALEHLEETQEKHRKKIEGSRRRDKIRQAVGLPEKKKHGDAKQKKSTLVKDWERNRTDLHPTTETPTSRALQALEAKNGRRDLRSSRFQAYSSASASDSDNSDKASSALMTPLPRLARIASQSSFGHGSRRGYERV